MNIVKRFIKTSIVYFIGSILSKLISFILLPLYTSKLSPNEFGVYDIVITILSLLVPVVFCQIWDAMFRFALDKNSTDEKYMVVSDSFIVWFMGGVVYTFIYVVFSNFAHFEFKLLIYVYGISVAVQYQYTFIARVFLKNNLFVMSGIINSFISAIVNIILILNFKMGIESLYIATILGCLVQVIIIEKKLLPLRYINIKGFKINYITKMLKFSIPLCIATISYWLLSGYTKIAILQQLGTYENGLYAVANKFSSMIILIISVFQYAWNEIAYLMAGEENRIASYEKSVQYILKVAILGSGVFLLFTKLFFPYFVSISYYDALYIMPLTILGVSANSFAGFTGTIFMAEKQTKYILWTTTIAVGVNICCTWIFTRIWGLQGAVGALSLSFVVLAFLRFLYLKKIFPIKLYREFWFNIILLLFSIIIFISVNNTVYIMLSAILLGCISIFYFKDIIYALWRTAKGGT